MASIPPGAAATPTAAPATPPAAHTWQGGAPRTLHSGHIEIPLAATGDGHPSVLLLDPASVRALHRQLTIAIGGVRRRS